MRRAGSTEQHIVVPAVQAHIKTTTISYMRRFVAFDHLSLHVLPTRSPVYALLLLHARSQLDTGCLLASPARCLPAHLFPRRSLKPNVRAVRCAVEDLRWQLISYNDEAGRGGYVEQSSVTGGYECSVRAITWEELFEMTRPIVRSASSAPLLALIFAGLLSKQSMTQAW